MSEQRPAVAELHIVAVRITHPDAAALVEEVQQEYVERYGGRDDSPIDPAEFDAPTGAFFVGYLDGEPVATGAWRRHVVPAGIEADAAVEIKRMYVAPRARGCGHARRMLAHLEATARCAGAGAIVLETGTRQPEAIALYASSGYLAVPGFGFYRDEPISRCFAKLLRVGQ